MTFVTFDTFSAAQADTMSQITAGVTDLVIILGYGAAGDGGGAQYITTTLELTSSGFFYSIPSETFWVIAVQPYNVKQFGAKVDGVTDDSDAINGAINYLFSRPHGGVLNFPPGTCVGNFTLYPGVILAGVSGDYRPGIPSSQRSILKSNPTPSTPWIVTMPGGAEYPTRKCGVVGLDFEGLGSGTTLGGVQITSVVSGGYSAWCVVKSCSFNNFAGQAIVDYGTDSYIIGNTASDCVLDTSVGQLTGVFELRGTDTQCHYNEVSAGLTDWTSENLYIVGILTGLADPDGFNENSSAGFVTGNIAEQCDIGFLLQGNFWRTMGNRAVKNAGPGYRLGDVSCNMVGDMAIDNSVHMDGMFSGFDDQGSTAGGGSKNLSGCKALVTSGNLILHQYGFDLSANYFASESAIYQWACIHCTSIGHAVATAVQNIVHPQSFKVGKSLYRYMGDNPNLDGTTLYHPKDTAAQELTGVMNVVIGNTYTFLGNSYVTIENNSATGSSVPFITNSGANVIMANYGVYQFLCIPNAAGTGLQLVELSGN